MKSIEHTEGTHSQDLWEALTNHSDFRKLRNLFAPFLGNPVWFLVNVKSFRNVTNARVEPKAAEIWKDPRYHDWQCCTHFLKDIEKKRKHQIPFSMYCRRHGTRAQCIPLFSNRTRFFFLVLAHHENRPLDMSALHLLYANLGTLTANVNQDAQLKKLSESLRPRLVALSAIHTVHRLCSITLNPHELFRRLAYLIAQVMRASECSILILERGRQTQRLIERGRTLGGKEPKTRPRNIRANQGMEGRVFTTAKRILRKNLLCLPLIDEDVIGVVTVKRKREQRGFNYLDEEILMALAEESVIAIKNAELYEEQKKVTLETIHSLAQILGSRFGHQSRIPSDTLLGIAHAVTDHFRMSDDERQAVHYAILLRDATKIGLPDEILKKNAKLTGEELRLVREHPVHGARMIQSFKSLKPVAPIILASHENYDGSGYPYGLRGEEIPLGSRILSVMNAFDAIIAGRPYKSSAGIQEALAEIRVNRGTQFDPRVVDMFQKTVEEPKIARLIKKTI